MIRLGTLTEVTQVNYDVNFINGFLEENYDYCIARIQNQIFLEEESEAEKTEDKTDGLLAWIKRNCINKPRDWFARMIKKLNAFAASIRAKELSRPGERGIWSKIKAKVAQFIVWLTNAMHKVVYRDGSGDAETTNNKYIDEFVKGSKASQDIAKNKDRQWKADNIFFTKANMAKTKKEAIEIAKRYANHEGSRKFRDMFRNIDNPLNDQLNALNKLNKEKENPVKEIKPITKEEREDFERLHKRTEELTGKKIKLPTMEEIDKWMTDPNFTLEL